jgi:predicted HicB family RNase H-like nuclease
MGGCWAKSKPHNMSTNHRKNGEFRKGHAIRQKGEKPADGHLHIRVTMETKGQWVAKSRSAGLPLSEWVTRTLNAAS